jgi:transposase
MLAAAIQAEILRLVFAEHWSLSRIARHLGVHRASVRKVVRRRSVALARAHPRPRSTLVTPFGGRIQALLAQDPERSAVNILQALRVEGYRGGITTLRAAVARLRATPAREAFVSLTFAPAERVQIDWGEFGDVFGIGRAVHAFLLVLCYSRLLTVEFTFSQTLEAFLRCHEHAFAFLGGCAREVQYDNLATVVAERRGRLVRWNPRFLAYAGHYGFRPVACTPARGNEKGRVEDSVKVPADELLAGADVPRSRRSERPGAGVARRRRQRPGARGHPEDPPPPRGGGAAAPLAAPRALRHRRGAECDRPAQLPRRLRWQPLLGPLAARREGAHAPSRCGHGHLLVRDAPGGPASPVLAARRGVREPGPR